MDSSETDGYLCSCSPLDEDDALENVEVLSLLRQNADQLSHFMRANGFPGPRVSVVQVHLFNTWKSRFETLENDTKSCQQSFDQLIVLSPPKLRRDQPVTTTPTSTTKIRTSFCC